MEIKESNSNVQTAAILVLIIIMAAVFWYAGGTSYVADHVTAAEQAWSESDDVEKLSDRISSATGADELFEDGDSQENTDSSEDDSDDLSSKAEEEIAKAEEKSDET